MIKIASQLLDNISEFAKNNKGLTAGILAGGGLGLLGGALTPTESEDPDEDAATRAKRRIGQAALLGSLGAAGAGALGYGLETVGNPIEEGGGLSFNNGLSLYTPAAAGVGAGIGGAILDNRAQEAEAQRALKVLKLAENDYVNSDDKLKAILPDVEKSKLKARDLLKGLSSAPDLRTRAEELINKGKTGYNSLDELLEAAGISSTDAGQKLTAENLKGKFPGMTMENLKNIFSKNPQGERQIIENLKNLVAASPADKLNAKGQLDRAWRFLKRNKRMAGLGALGAALTGYWANKD
jgi:hypothetical protein